VTVWLWAIIAFIYGVAIGSFLNVVIWRLPRGLTVSAPTWSFCPRCEHRLGALDLVPVLSFAALRGRCRYCHAPISWRYPGIELLTGLLFALVGWRFGGMAEAVIFNCLFVALLVCVFFIDLEHFIIPDGLNVLAMLVGFAHNAVSIALHRPGQWTALGPFFVPSSLAGWLGYAALVYGFGLVSYVWIVSVLDKRLKPAPAAFGYLRENAIDWLYVGLSSLGTVVPPVRRYVARTFGEAEPAETYTAEDIEGDEDAGGMGGGDGKLAAAIGANIGLALAVQSFFFAVFMGALGGVVVMARQRRTLGQRTAVPFGPSMAAGAYLAMMLGGGLLAWYLGRFHGVN